jgi:alpha-beta hydrolase superfamily lysophospholipase
MSTAAAETPLRGFFASRDGLQLYHEIWAARTPSRVGTCLFVHGYGDHCARYPFASAHFPARGFEWVTFDYRGHGQAAGARGHCFHFEELLDDFEAALQLTRKRAGAAPLFVVATSHGALVALRYFLDPARRPPPVRGLVLLSPFFAVKMTVPPVKVALGKVVSRIWPRLSMQSGIRSEDLSRDPAVVEAHRRDRWTHPVATARWFTECQAAQAYCLEHAGRLAMPILVAAAGDDRVVSSAASRAVFDRMTAADRQYVLYPESFHELFNDLGRQKVLDEVEAWLSTRAG